MPSAPWMILAARSPSSQLIACARRLVMGYALLTSGELIGLALRSPIAPPSPTDGRWCVFRYPACWRPSSARWLLPAQVLDVTTKIHSESLRYQMLRPAFSQYGARSLRLKILPESSRGSHALSS